MTDTEEIKQRLDIVEIVSEYVQLKQSGTNWKGLCPFHREKTPSFMVSKDRQIFKCFGCGEGGDAFAFLMKMEGLDFPDALKILAQKAGVPLKQFDPSVSSKKNKLLDVTALTANLWHHLLTQSEKGKKVLEYLQERKINEEAITEFKLGFAPDSWDATGNFLMKRGHKADDIFAAGLTVKKERGSGYYDRFRNRLIFPIFDTHGNPVAFGGRELESVFAKKSMFKKKESGAKYINSPQTPIYNKSAVIYNLNKAKQYIRQMGYALVVEGYMDVLACWRAGFLNVIATSGTAFTQQQIQILKRYSPNLVLCFDADLAGQSAVDRGIDLALATDMNIKVVVLEEGKDPDDVIKKDVESFKRAVKDAKSIMEYYFEKTLKKYPKEKPLNRKVIKDTLLAVIKKIADRVVQEYWLKELAATLDVSENILREELSKVKSDVVRTAPEPTQEREPLPTKDRRTMLEERVLSLLLQTPAFIPETIEQLDQKVFVQSLCSTLYKSLNIYYTRNKNDVQSDSFNVAAFKQHVASSQDGNPDDFVLYIDSLTLMAENDFENFSEAQRKDELLKSVLALKREYLNVRLKDLIQALKNAEALGDMQEVERITNEVGKVYSEKSLLDV